MSAAAPRLRIGVGVPTLDEEAALPALLARLLGAPDAARGDPSDLADRVVVADAGSRDRTVALARAGGAEALRVGRGRGEQLAAAAEALLGDPPLDVLLFLHADCRPRAGALRAVRAAFAAGLEAAAFRQVIAGEGRLLRRIERAADARVRRGMAYGDSGLAVTPAAYARAGGYPRAPLFEDVALSKALARVGARVRLLEGAVLETSARRWQLEGALRCTLRNWMLRGLYELGVSPTRLARLYRPHTTP